MRKCDSQPCISVIACLNPCITAGRKRIRVNTCLVCLVLDAAVSRGWEETFCLIIARYNRPNIDHSLCYTSFSLHPQTSDVKHSINRRVWCFKIRPVGGSDIIRDGNNWLTVHVINTTKCGVWSAGSLAAEIRHVSPLSSSSSWTSHIGQSNLKSMSRHRVHHGRHLGPCQAQLLISCSRWWLHQTCKEQNHQQSKVTTSHHFILD